MELARLICYGAGLLMALVLAGQLYRIRHSLAKLLAGMMLAWALNCLTLFVMLFMKIQGLEGAESVVAPLWSVNAAILVAGPLVLYAWFLRANGRIRDES